MNTTAQTTQIAGYDVLDSQGNKIGTVDATWLNGTTNDLQFIGVKTAWLIGKTHVVPVDNAQIDSNNQTVQVPYSEDQVKNAPTFDPNTVLDQNQQNQITNYYQNLPTPSSGPSQQVVAVPGKATQPGNFPVDNVLYDLYTLISQKLEGLQAYDEYLQDAQGDSTLTNLLTRLREQDGQGVEQLQQYLVQRLAGRGQTGS